MGKTLLSAFCTNSLISSLAACSHLGSSGGSWKCRIWAHVIPTVLINVRSAEDDVDGAVDVSYDYNSGDTFPIGETVVTCSAQDAAGNTAEESFTITVQDTTDPDVEITRAVDRSGRKIVEGTGSRAPIPYIRITFEATDAVGIDSTECSLDGGAFTSCTSPVSYNRLSRGTHEFTVRATDEAGNIGEDQFTWTVGSLPPSNNGGGSRNR